jgi:TIR domain
MSEKADRSEETYFLSYSRSDERFALRLAKDLRAHGVAMWVDQLDIRPSEHWDRAIERAVSACRGLVVVLSPRSVASDNVADEISFAIDSGKSVLPVMIEKCVLPLRITRMHVVDATGSYDKALRQCLGELQRPGKAGEDKSAARALPPLDPQTVSEAKRQLAAILGPIAEILVDKAAGRAASAADLYGQLALNINDEDARERFLTNGAAGSARSPASGMNKPVTPANRTSAIAPSEIASLAAALTPYLGPIAPIVAERESRACTSSEELRRRLAALISAERDRTAFLKRATVSD